MIPNNDLIMNAFPAQTSSVSLVQWSQKIIRSSWQVSVSSGSLNGTFTVQGSNDLAQGLPPGQFQPTNWSTLNSVTVVCSSSAPGAQTFLIQNVELAYEYLRLNYVVGNSGAALGVYSVRQKSMGL